MADPVSGVTPEAIAARMRRSTDQLGGIDYIVSVLSEVEGEVSSWARRQFGLTLADLDQSELAAAVLDVTRRRIQLEESGGIGVQSRTTTIADGSVTLRYSESAADMLADLGWWERLAPIGLWSSGAFSIVPSNRPDLSGDSVATRGWRSGSVW